MITIECAWCDAELVLDGLGATSVDCPDCLVSVEVAPDALPDIPLAA